MRMAHPMPSQPITSQSSPIPSQFNPSPTPPHRIACYPYPFHQIPSSQSIPWIAAGQQLSTHPHIGRTYPGVCVGFVLLCIICVCLAHCVWRAAFSLGASLVFCWTALEYALHCYSRSPRTLPHLHSSRIKCGSDFAYLLLKFLFASLSAANIPYSFGW